jgi:hypothetical protein
MAEEFQQLSPQAEVMAQNGDYDWSHFVHGFREFGSLSPSLCLKRRGSYTKHVSRPGGTAKFLQSCLIRNL